MEMKEKIVDVLKECFDPEIPIDLWNLGLIYDINLKEENNLYDVDIIMSLTTPGCSMGQHMADDIKSKLKPFTNIKNVHVNVIFDPPWKPEMMTDFARKKLGFDPVKNKNKERKIELEWE
jgi:metal-sulfur cluster biosynthetic enzyme